MTSRFKAKNGLDNNNQTLINVSSPINDTDGANKQYVDIVASLATNAIPLVQKGAPNGVATLDADGLIPTDQLPSYVDEVQEFPSLADFPIPGESNKIYVAVDVHKVYRWSGSEYIDISASAGTADEAIKLATARTITLSGDVSGSTSFDGSQNVTIVATVADNSHNHNNATPTTNGFMSASDKAKLDTVDEYSNNYVLPNATDLVLGGVKKGTNVHIDSGVISVNTASTTVVGVTQLSSSVSSTSTTTAATPSAVKQAYDLAFAAIPSSQKGAINGVATLDSTGHVPASQLPSYVDDVLEYASLDDFPSVGETAKIYVAIDSNKIYRWSGSAYIEISPTAGNADTATKLSTPRTISASGDATWSVSFDGSQNVTSTLMLSDSGVSSGQYTKVTVDSKGRVTVGSQLDASDIPSLDASKITTGTISNSLLSGTYTGFSISGNAGTATKLETARTINGVSFDGTSNVTIADGTKLPLSGGTLTGELEATSIKLTTLVTTDQSSHYIVETGTDGIIRPKLLSDVRNEIGAYLSDDATTVGTLYPIFTSSSSGTLLDASVSSTKLTFNPSTGDLGATNFNSLSDVRYKTNITPINNALQKIMDINGYSYDWKECGGSSYGVIAQEVIDILPNAVSVNESGRHSVNYSAIIPFLIEAIKEQQRQIEELRNSK